MTDHPLAQLAPFTSELDRLCWLVEVLTARGAKGMNPKHESSDEDLVAAATSLVSNGLQNARGAVNLLKGDLVMAAGPVERALYEIWCEVRMLFEQGSRGARKMFLNSLLELVETGSSNGSADQELKVLYRRISEELETRYPDEAAEVRDQRRRRRFHWSGLTRRQLSELGSPNGLVYRLLSWETHATHVAVRDQLGFYCRGSNMEKQFPAARAEYMNPEQVAFRCSAYLSDMWDRYFELFSLPPIAWPKAE